MRGSQGGGDFAMFGSVATDAARRDKTKLRLELYKQSRPHIGHLIDRGHLGQSQTFLLQTAATQQYLTQRLVQATMRSICCWARSICCWAWASGTAATGAAASGMAFMRPSANAGLAGAVGGPFTARPHRLRLVTQK
jgi:hypothetical protein